MPPALGAAVPTRSLQAPATQLRTQPGSPSSGTATRVQDGWWGRGAPDVPCVKPPCPNTAAELSPAFWGSDLAVPEITGSKARGKRGDGDFPGPKHGHWLVSPEALQHAAAQVLEKPFHPLTGAETG